MMDGNPVYDVIRNFEKVQRRFAVFGADDSEPSDVFWGTVIPEAIQGKNELLSAEDWQLYTSSVDCRDATAQLNLAAYKVYRSIQDTPFHQVMEALRYYDYDVEVS